MKVFHVHTNYTSGKKFIKIRENLSAMENKLHVLDDLIARLLISNIFVNLIV